MGLRVVVESPEPTPRCRILCGTEGSRNAARARGEGLDVLRAVLEFGDIDWSGEAARDRDPLADLHPYPARFISPIPDALLGRYGKPGARVLDPFCGSGTTLVSAMRAGYDATGVDLHPIACLISRVKTASYNDHQLGSVEAVAGLPIVPAHASPSLSSQIPRLDHWFNKGVQEALEAIVASIGKHEVEAEREVLMCALSKIIVRVSRQESDTRYAAVEKNVSYTDVLDSYRRSVRDVCAALREGRVRGHAKARVLNRDILATKPADLAGPFDLVITSPPYPNAYEYWLYHKYRMYWLGYDPLAVRQSEIGARPHYFTKKPQTAADFERQMAQVFGLLRSVTTPQAPCCFVISDAIIHGEIINNRELMARAGAQHGYALSEGTLRTIPSHRKSFNPMVSPRSEEHVLVFERSR